MPVLAAVARVKSHLGVPALPSNRRQVQNLAHRLPGRVWLGDPGLATSSTEETVERADAVAFGNCLGRSFLTVARRDTDLPDVKKCPCQSACRRQINDHLAALDYAIGLFRQEPGGPNPVWRAKRESQPFRAQRACAVESPPVEVRGHRHEARPVWGPSSRRVIMQWWLPSSQAV